MNKYETFLLQDQSEFTLFLALIKSEGVRSFLEIGSKHGGSFWRISNSLLSGSRVVSVDLPHGDTSFKESEPHLRACVDALKKKGYDAHLFIGDSTDAGVVERVRRLDPFDLVFIDANHTEPYVWNDWHNYGPMSRKMVAFHDIGHVNLPHKTKKMPIDVPKVWNKIKHLYRHKEIRFCPASNGIGILWMSQPT